MNPRLVRRIFLLSFIILLLLIVFSPIKLDYRIQCSGIVYPRYEWKLIQSNGSLYSFLQDNKLGIKEDYTNYEFERGDISQLRIEPQILSSRTVSKGELIAKLNSVQLTEEIEKLKNELQIEEALLKSNITGVKKSELQVLEAEVNLAKKQLEQTQIIYDRKAILYRDSVYTEADFETVSNLLKTHELNLKIAERKYKAAESGSKQEDIELIKARIEGFKNQITLLEERQTTLSISSPISGIVNMPDIPEEVLTISNQDQQIAVVAVEMAQQEFLNDSSEIQIRIPGYSDLIAKPLPKLNKKVSYIGNKQIVFAKVILPADLNLSFLGAQIQSEIICDRIPLRTYMARAIKLNIK